MEQIPFLPVQIVLLVFMILGIVSLFLVIIPGLVITWAAILISIAIHGFTNGFSTGTIVLVVVETLIMIAGNLIDNLVIGASARGKGASWISLAVALAAGIAGTIFFPPIGGLIAAPIGLMIAETVRLKNYRSAFSTTKGMVTGCGWAVIIRVLIGATMIFGWLIWIYFTYFYGSTP